MQIEKVLYVTPRYFPFMGGVESHVYEVARRMARDGAEVTVLTTDPRGDLLREEVIEGVKIRRVRAMPANRDYYFAPELYKIISRGTWDVIHIQSYHTLIAPLAMLAAARAKIPYVVTFHSGGHSSSLRNRSRKYQRRLLRPLLARAAGLVAVAECEREAFETQLNLPAEKFVVIPNGAELPEPVEASESANGETWIASVGRLEPYKGHQRVIAALPFLVQQKPDIHLWIAGVGPYEPELKRLANELGVAERVRIMAIPPSDRAGMARELSKMALVVLLSEYETHPIAILEALSLKRPVLVAKTPGLNELVARGAARGVALKSTAQATAAAMLEQLEHPLVGSRLDLWSWDDCTRRLLDLYHDVMRRNECAF